MVYLLGCDHYLQAYELGEFMQECRDIQLTLKRKFYDLLRDIVVTNEIDFIGEECRTGVRTIAGVIAEECRRPYAVIDMPVEARRQAGIPDDYEERGSGARMNGYIVREEWMFNRCLGYQANRRLVVCGSEHVDRLANRFREIGEDVFMRIVNQEGWFDPPYARLQRGGL